ncbi:MAG: TonB-dependent receptor [Endomicrobiaceae bacterium]|nr:TonB-dependent receptor [Endomicrobiaceae bacterium]
MKKIILLAITMALCTQVFASGQNDTENKEEVFLSLTKFAEPLKDLGTNLTVITRKNIEEKNAKTLGDVLEDELGISYKSYGPLGQTVSISMRGATAGQTLVLIDGRRVNEIGTGGGADFNSIPASMIEKVEIIRGSGSAMYGTGAFGGVINVITKKADILTPNINPYFSYGTFNTINAGITGAYANETVSMLVAPSVLSSDGYRTNSFYNSKNIFGNFAVKPTENSEIAFSGQFYDADFGNPGPVAWASNTAKQFEKNNYSKLDYNTKYQDFDIKISGYDSQNKREAYDFVNYYANTYYTDTIGIKSLFSYKEFIFAGMEWEKTAYKQLDDMYGMEQINRSRENSAFYMQSILNIEKLTLIPVIRSDMNTDYSDVATPALSAIFKINDFIKLSGNISKVWNAPTFGQIYGDNTWYIANHDLKPEKGTSSDIGIEYASKDFSAMLTCFYIDTNNLIQNILVDPVMYQYQAQNIGQTKQYGYEVELGYNMFKILNHKLNYTYLRASDTNTNKDLTYKPMHKVNYALTILPVKQVKINADVSYTATTLDEYRNYFKDYCTVNLRVDYHITKNISIWAKCDNITNETYQLSLDYPMPGVTGYSGIDIKF